MSDLDGARLAELRFLGDPEADDWVATQSSGLALKDRKQWLDASIENLRSLHPVDPDWVLEWQTNRVELPSWVKPDLVSQGQQVFDDWALDLTTALFFASLPYCFASGRGAAVLAGISQLFDPARTPARINLTGRMLVDISAPRALETGATGYRTLRRVRLLHACVRARILADESWPVELLGVPINQEDLLATQVAFTTIAFTGVERLCYPLDEEEKSAYLHLWAVAGTTLGIQHAADLRHLDVAERVSAVFLDTLEVATPYGAQLMRSLLDSISSAAPRPLKGLPTGMVRCLAGARIADMLGVPHTPWERLIAGAARVDRWVARITFGRVALRLPSRLVGRASIQRSIARGATAVEPSSQWPDRFGSA